jgi:hypothetical protein
LADGDDGGAAQREQCKKLRSTQRSFFFGVRWPAAALRRACGCAVLFYCCNCKQKNTKKM